MVQGYGTRICDLVKELKRLMRGPPGYSGSLLPFLNPKNKDFQTEMDAWCTLKDQMGAELESKVFWRKPGGKYSWRGSEEWISNYQKAEQKENKPLSDSTPVKVVLRMCTRFLAETDVVDRWRCIQRMTSGWRTPAGETLSS